MSKMRTLVLKSLSFIVFFAGLAGTSPCWATFYDVLDNGEILPRGNFKLTTPLELLTDSGGANIGATLDTGFQEDFGLRAMVGTGRTDYFAGGMVKWMPIPDIDSQPAIGLNMGLLYGHMDGNRDFTIRAEPLLSKKFKIEGGSAFTPYVSTPIGIRMRSSDSDGTNTTDVAFQIALGAQLKVERWESLQFMGEVGFDINNAISYISLAAVWYFDQHGFEIK